jgi:hypothetical protein
MTEHRQIQSGEDNLDTCAACEWASWDTAPSFAEHVELMAAVDAEALGDASARESAWTEFRDGPDYTPTDRYPARDAFDAGWSFSLASAGSEGWAAYAAEQERHAETSRKLEKLRDDVACLHDVYTVHSNEPRCCSDCAANDISNELRRVLRDVQ